ncbi:MAG: cytochrome c biogenesis protein ResB [Chloroflexota bacterium]
MLQISFLAIAGVFGTVLRQLPAFSLHDPAAYADQMAETHAIYDPLSIFGLNVGPGMVDLFERLGLFRVFSAPWFILLLTLLVVSIVVCTLDRLPGLWRAAHNVKVVQAAPFFDLRLDNRARFTQADDAAADQLANLLKGQRYRVRQDAVPLPVAEAAADASADAAPATVRHLYFDKNQYLKLSTLFTHLGLILFLAGAAVTTALGYETVIFLGEGQTAPVQAVGTPDNLLVKNIHFEAPTRPDGSFADFRTDLAVYQNGSEVARKIIRVNDPLQVNGYVFHQNTFGPAENLTIWDPQGRLVWDGPVLLAGALAGKPQGFLTIPGSTLGLLVVLDRSLDGAPLLALTGISAETQANGGNICFLRVLGLGSTTEPGTTCGYTVGWKSAGAYTGMVIKRDPGVGFIWIAYISLIIGLTLSFYFPRRRIWARLHGDHLELAMLADRYVDTEREFNRLLDDMAARLRNRPERHLQPSSGSGRN